MAEFVMLTFCSILLHLSIHSTSSYLSPHQVPGTKVIAGAVEVNKTTKISTLIPGVRNDNKEDGEVIYVRLWKVQRGESKQERGVGNIGIMGSIFREGKTEMTYFKRH